MLAPSCWCRLRSCVIFSDALGMGLGRVSWPAQTFKMYLHPFSETLTTPQQASPPPEAAPRHQSHPSACLSYPSFASSDTSHLPALQQQLCSSAVFHHMPSLVSLLLEVGPKSPVHQIPWPRFCSAVEVVPDGIVHVRAARYLVLRM